MLVFVKGVRSGSRFSPRPSLHVDVLLFFVEKTVLSFAM